MFKIINFLPIFWTLENIVIEILYTVDSLYVPMC